jgi:glucan biosynthesis protein
LAAGLAIAPAVDAAAADTPADTPFAAAAVRNLARELALKPYQPPDAALPDALKSLDYSAYQTLRTIRARRCGVATVENSPSSSSIAATCSRTASTSSR